MTTLLFVFNFGNTKLSSIGLLLVDPSNVVQLIIEYMFDCLIYDA